MTLHAHEHRSCWDVTKDDNEICSEFEPLPSMCILGVDAHSKNQKLLRHGPCKGIKVMRLLQARDDPKNDDIVVVEALFWREIVIVDDERPCRLCLPLMRRVPICRKPQSNVPMSAKEEMFKCVVVDIDLLLEKRCVVGAVKYILNLVFHMRELL
jgi:hypothetical protein